MSTPLKDSDLQKWKYKEYTRIKHILLEKYLYAWILVLGSWNSRTCYFDCFAGRGEYLINNGKSIYTGSPLVALRIAKEIFEKGKKKNKRYFQEFNCFFIEKDPDNFQNLKKILNSQWTRIENINYYLIHDEFRNVAGKLFKQLDEKKEKIAPSFFFIDPFGFSGVPFGIIKKVLKFSRTEVFITFMVRDLSRFLSDTKCWPTLIELYGTDEWKEGLKLKEKEREIFLINLYRKILHEKANVKFSLIYNVSMETKKQTVYYLIHATNNCKGHYIMKNIMQKQSVKGVTGIFGYLGPDEEKLRSQRLLFNYPKENINDCKKFLLERFKNKSLKFGDILEQSCIPYIQEPPYVESTYRNAIKELEKEEKVKVNRIESKKTGLKENDIITFTVGFPSVFYNTYKLLDGTPKRLVEKVGDGSIITRFTKTPSPRNKNDVVCPHFLELKWATGCPFNCAWCYLKGTLRMLPQKKAPKFKNRDKIKLHILSFFAEKNSQPEILNAGELADSLMGDFLELENGEEPFSKFIIPLFETQNKHKILFLTKSNKVNHLLEITPHNQVIMSFTLNADPVAKKWEKGPPTVEERILAAKKVYDAGYETRIRIDPMVPIKNWERYYIQLIEEIFKNFIPERITIGSLRGLQSTLNGCKENADDLSWAEYLKEKTNWGKKVDFETRYKMYFTMIDYLKKKYAYKNVGLCKETLEMWNKLGMDYRKIKCNCVQ